MRLTYDLVLASVDLPLIFLHIVKQPRKASGDQEDRRKGLQNLQIDLNCYCGACVVPSNVESLNPVIRVSSSPVSASARAKGDLEFADHDPRSPFSGSGDPHSLRSASMEWDDKIIKQPEEETHESWILSLHSLSDLSHISPIVFLYLIKECYASGTLKATRKFGECVDRKMLKYVYVTIKKKNLLLEFADVYHQCKESSLKQLAEKGCWDVAESKAKGDKQHIEYQVYLAMEAGYSEKVDELCDQYSLQGFPKAKEFDATLLHRKHYLCLKELGVEDVFWVDRVDSLHTATCYIEESKVVGVDCEWKPNYVKGSKPNKLQFGKEDQDTVKSQIGDFLSMVMTCCHLCDWLVSIMQIASSRRVFIFDLIKLSGDIPHILANCLSRILQSPSILKLDMTGGDRHWLFQCVCFAEANSFPQNFLMFLLYAGYNFQCDMKQLTSSYETLGCFNHFEMLLDIQNVFKESSGGLSGLAEEIPGTGLNKTRRNSDWE
ncbi:hypothetical protein NL676_030477 [Syzygium grande]|nr:hypothetical protein NL676_030477 [Syzygium grande]